MEAAVRRGARGGEQAGRETGLRVLLKGGEREDGGRVMLKGAEWQGRQGEAG